MGVLDHMDHLDHVQTWDGTKFEMMDAKEARRLAKAGSIQITTGLQAKDLKYPDEFKTSKGSYETASDLPPGLGNDSAAEPKKTRKRTYKTRQLKADSDGNS